MGRTDVLGMFHKPCTDLEKHRPIHIARTLLLEVKKDSKSG